MQETEEERKEVVKGEERKREAEREGGNRDQET